MSSVWDSITEETTIQLSKLDININFGNPEPKNDAYVKAKTGISCCKWVFAKRKTDHAVWIELELTPKQGTPQNDLFSYLKKNKLSIEESVGASIELTENGKHRRVKSYLQNTNIPNLNECVKRMVSFVVSIRPYLFKYSSLGGFSEENTSNDIMFLSEYQLIDKKEGTIQMVSSRLHLYDYFADKRFFFSREVITRYYIALKTKPFVLLTGISGIGKTKIAQIFAQYICQDENPESIKERIAFVSVRPDWVDNKGILGFYNILDEKYHSTKILDLLLRAEKNPDKPYFVILDEMNLAKVEHYFSDFLSIMESRTVDNPAGEAIPLHPCNSACTINGTEVPSEINIPTNVFFTGTVNVDESTYMFSPKVLDRANVIEFNEVSLKEYAGGSTRSEHFFLRNPEVIGTFFDSSNSSFCRKDDYLVYLKQHERENEYLLDLAAILQEYNLHFGYRVVNEFSKFINLAGSELEKFSLEEAIDIQIIQKILTKFHGTRAKLEEPLNHLFSFCYMDNPPVSEYLLKKARNYDSDARFPRAAKKIAQMLNQLSIQGYASFIE
ncbi:MAG: DUF4268 domain-containing protein [Bacteroidota bacterium]|nr:DUF4268 domain-containing protein [Bacteroidota bacterium]